MNVPIAILVHALKHKKVNQLKLYLYLKSITSGHFKATDRNIEELCGALNWKKRVTFKTNAQWLLKQGWITYNSKRKSIRIVSYTRLYKQLDSRAKSGVSMDIAHFGAFRPFIYAAVITWAMTAKKRIESKPERKKGRSRKSVPYSHYFTLPLRYAAKIVDLDYSTISRYKTIAEESGFIKVHHKYQKIDLNIRYLDTMRKYMEEEGYRFVVHNKRIHMQQPDLIQSNIHLKYKKRKHYAISFSKANTCKRDTGKTNRTVAA
jgi:hypothetical protein